MGRLATKLKNYDRIALDTNMFIYLLEKNETYFDLCKELFTEIELGRIYGITSTLMITEILSKPIEEKNESLIALYRTFFKAFPNLLIKEFNYKIKTPDSIFIATALNEKADIFITNDIKLKKIDEIKILILNNFVENDKEMNNDNINDS